MLVRRAKKNRPAAQERPGKCVLRKGLLLEAENVIMHQVTIVSSHRVTHMASNGFTLSPRHVAISCPPLRFRSAHLSDALSKLANQTIIPVHLSWNQSIASPLPRSSSVAANTVPADRSASTIFRAMSAIAHFLLLLAALPACPDVISSQIISSTRRRRASTSRTFCLHLPNPRTLRCRPITPVVLPLRPLAALYLTVLLGFRLASRSTHH